MTRVLVTGATGFVGRVLCDVLAQSGYLVRAALHGGRPVPASVAEKVLVGDICASTDWSAALHGVDQVIHLAARAHVLHDAQANSHLYATTNAQGTQRLALAAAQSGVQRFIYLSSVKVNGEETRHRAYTSFDEPRPQDPYGLSKWLGERSIADAVATAPMEGVIVRSPLVYGPGVRANFLRLLQWVDRRWPLPLGAVQNSRSLVSVWNLCDLLANVLKNPAARGGVWMVSDGEDLSTPELIRRLAREMNRRVHLLPIPVGMLQLCGAMLGRKAEVARLCSSLAVDITQTRDELHWHPPVPVDEGLARTVIWYLTESKSRGL